MSSGYYQKLERDLEHFIIPPFKLKQIIRTNRKNFSIELMRHLQMSWLPRQSLLRQSIHNINKFSRSMHYTELLKRRLQISNSLLPIPKTSRPSFPFYWTDLQLFLHLLLLAKHWHSTFFHRLKPPTTPWLQT